MKDTLVMNVECFNLKYTLECGQCFRWEENEDWYTGVIKDRVLKLRQEKNKLYVKSSNMEDLEQVVKNYFDLDIDYKKIEDEISLIDENVKKAVKNTSGIRILNQDLFEMIMSYIISANNNIPRISRSIKDISKKYGKKIVFENEEYYLFPTIQELANVTEEDFQKTGVGFRARYLKNTVKDILDGKFCVEDVNNLETKEAKEKLQKLQGVGPKVSDCILLFSCGRKEVFPIDVWVERVMHNLYFKNSTKRVRKNDILEYATSNFGAYAGVVQQHLFHNIRNNLI